MVRKKKVISHTFPTRNNANFGENVSAILLIDCSSALPLSEDHKNASVPESETVTEDFDWL